MIDKELMKEIEKNRIEEIVAKEELEKAKNDFINEINNGMGQEIREKCHEKPLKVKKPLFTRIKQVIKRITDVIG